MKQRELASVVSKVAIGQPLNFNVRSSDGMLLLAVGQTISSQEQLAALLERGALVDGEADEAQESDPARCPPQRLDAIWSDSLDRIGQALKEEPTSDFEAELNRAAATVAKLIERDADLAIFRVVRQTTQPGAQYGVTHSMHAAIAARLAANRLGWSNELCETAFKAALTMNLSILGLQGALANQLTPLVPSQREEIRQHPQRSAEMLREAGISNAVWLQAVAEHHELPGGKGYPAKLQEVSELAGLLRRADIYTAKLSARANRVSMPAHVAARALYTQEHGHPVTAALIKEFGIYPPGCWVKLASGETAVVTRRGANSSTPMVASLLNKQGQAWTLPQRRATADPANAIVEVIPERKVKAFVTPNWLTVAMLP